MKRITKYFPSLEKAEKFQFSLYGKYNSVKLITSPLFSEAGTYSWEVK